MRKVSLAAGQDAGVIQLESRWSDDDHLLIEAGFAARGTVIEGCTAPQGAGRRRARIDVHAAPGAELKVIVLQALPPSVENDAVITADGGRLIDVSLGGAPGSRRRFELGRHAELLAVARGEVEVRGGKSRIWRLPYEAPAGQVAFLRARGLGAREARRMLLSGWLEPVMRELPVEFAVELERLLDLDS